MRQQGLKMGRLEPDLTPSFTRDVKRLDKKHIATDPLLEVMELILENTKETKRILERHHNMHALKGAWKDSLECHVANVGDWLLIWCVQDGFAVFERTGTHDELFKKS